MRFCSYLITDDVGFAPNPFGDFCSLAACTPNHMGLRVEPGDWLMGNGQPEKGSRLIYAMRISEVLDFDHYYRCPLFEGKKPNRGSWQTRCGDNIYFRDGTGRWAQDDLACYHTGPGWLEEDTRHPRVFISDHFYYFGENAPVFPNEYTSLIKRGRGCRYARDPDVDVVDGFIEWLNRTNTPGRHGLPRDRDAGQIVRIAPMQE
jgi:hypothetical protein